MAKNVWDITNQFFSKDDEEEFVQYIKDLDACFYDLTKKYCVN